MAEASVPVEEEIDRELDVLAVKILDGTAKAAERARYNELVARRTALLQPPRIVVDRWHQIRRFA
jgi:hypothetical protein